MIVSDAGKSALLLFPEALDTTTLVNGSSCRGPDIAAHRLRAGLRREIVRVSPCTNSLSPVVTKILSVSDLGLRRSRECPPSATPPVPAWKITQVLRTQRSSLLLRSSSGTLYDPHVRIREPDSIDRIQT